jgi:protein-S-isoprenylcysteine O-methyltransferase Ste14
MSGAEPAHRGPIPPVIFLCSLVVQAALDRFAPAVRLVPEAWTFAGLVPLAGGLILAGIAAARFRSVETDVHPFGEPTALVTSGPYRLTRNPMYLGLSSMLLGIAVLLGSLTPFLVPPAFGWIITRRFIEMEEMKMSRIFGEEYDAYRGRVRRWL